LQVLKLRFVILIQVVEHFEHVCRHGCMHALMLHARAFTYSRSTTAERVEHVRPVHVCD
jgi:hypothetical protein